MSDSETSMAVAAAIASLDEDNTLTQVLGSTEMPTGAMMSTLSEPEATGKGVNGLISIKLEPMDQDKVVEERASNTPEVDDKPKPAKVKVMSCLLCTKPLTPENTQLGSSNSSSEYERVMRIVCKLLCIDSHHMLQQYKFRHSEEPKKLCCDDCCEVAFNLGSLQSTMDRTRLAMNMKVEWILKTVAESAAVGDKDEGIEKVFFSAKSDAFRAEVLKVHQRKLAEESAEDDDPELLNKGVQTDVSGESGVVNGSAKPDRIWKSNEQPNFSFHDGTNMETDMDTNSDHNDDLELDNGQDDPNSSSIPNGGGISKSNPKVDPVSSSSSSSYSNNSRSIPAKKRGRPSNGKLVSTVPKDTNGDGTGSDDDDIEVLEERKTQKKTKANASSRIGISSGKSPKIDARTLLKVEYNSEESSGSGVRGRPKRSTAAKRPNYKMLSDEPEEDQRRPAPASNRRGNGTTTTASQLKAKRPVQVQISRKEVNLTTTPIVKDATGRTYFEGVEIVRTERNISCKYMKCSFVVEGCGYNAFEQIKLHVHENHLRKNMGSLPYRY